MDIIFQSPRFDKDGEKTAHAKFVRVVHNGVVIQENQEVPYASGTNWDRKQYPQGPIIFQGDYGPIALRNVRVRSYKAGAEHMPVPPEGFTALFNGKDLTGWHTPPLVKEYWFIEDGVLKSPGLIKHWGASLATKKHYRDFILMLDFRMPTISDSGINFRRLIPEIKGFGDMEQFNHPGAEWDTWKVTTFYRNRLQRKWDSRRKRNLMSDILIRKSASGIRSS
jgi:hypothetical protein